MRATLSCALLALCLLAAPAVAQKVYVDYDGATAFSEFRTFQMRETAKDLRRNSPRLHDRVVQKLTEYMIEGALEPTTSEPDVYVAYYAAYIGDLRLVLSDLEYTYGDGFTPGSYWEGGVGTRQVSAKEFNFKEGTIVIDVWDRERGILVWRGMATSALKPDYAKREARLEKALDKLMKQWEKTYGGRARAIRKMKVEKDGG